MIKEAMAGNIDLIITKSISRFARNTVDALTNIRKLKEKNVEVFFVKENIHSLDSKCEVMLSILSSLSQEESRSISLNTSWGIHKKFADGKIRISTKYFLGYDMVDGKLEVNKDEAKVIKLIYGLFLKGDSMYQITKELNNRNIKTPMGKDRWHISTVRNVLRNEKYKGDCLLKKGFTADFLTKKRKVNNGELPQYYIEADHEAIIEPQVFDEVQVELGKRNRKYTSKCDLSSKIICAECGSFYGRKVWHSNDKYKKAIYQCNEKFKNHCKTMNVDENAIKELFIKKYNELDKKQEVKDTEEILENLTDLSGLKKQLEEESCLVSSIIDRINNLTDLNATSRLDQQDYRKKHADLMIEYEAAKAKEMELENLLKDKEERAIKIKSYLSTIKKHIKLKEFDKGLFNAVVEKVLVSHDEIKIVWKGE